MAHPSNARAFITNNKGLAIYINVRNERYKIYKEFRYKKNKEIAILIHMAFRKRLRDLSMTREQLFEHATMVTALERTSMR